MPDHLSPLSRRTMLGGVLALTCLASLPASVPALAETAPERILVIGDSQAQGLAAGLQRLYRSDRTRRVLDRTKIGTGLIPRPNYDWPVQAQTIATAEHYDVAVMLIGANDRPPVRRGGEIAPELVDRFCDTYGARVATIADAFRNAGVPLIWVGHPVVKDPQWTEDVGILDDIFSARVPAEGETYFSTWDMFTDANGAFTAYGRGTDGLTQRLRADDGVHLTPAGYDVLAAALAPSIDRYRPPHSAAT